MDINNLIFQWLHTAISGSSTEVLMPLSCNVVVACSGIRYKQGYNCISANVFNVTNSSIFLRSLYSNSNREMETDVIIIGY